MITFEFETIHPDTDEPCVVDIEATVESCRDAYGTGDSPTLYEVELTATLDGESFELSGKELDRAEDMAIKIYNEG